METIYLLSALVGGTLLACQFLLSVLGLGGHHDIGGHDLHDVGGHDVSDAGDHDAHAGGHAEAHQEHSDSLATWFVGLLTFRTLVAALTFFGLAGLAATREWGEGPSTFLVALAAGGAALFLMATLMRSLSRLKAEGTLRMDRALGRSGTVYLPIPGPKAGAGKVHLNVQNRTVECQAVTAKDGLPTGAPVVVVAVLGPDTVEVAPAPVSGD